MSTNDSLNVELPIKRETGDTLKETLTSNAYNNILPARYLRKDEFGNLIEEPENLFERVAKNIALADVVYEAEKRDITVKVQPDQVKDNHNDRESLVEEVFGSYADLGDNVKAPLTEDNVSNFSYDNVVPELENDELREAVEETKDEFQDMMESLGFMPNSPTLMNAGDELQQLSACFVNSPVDDMEDIHTKVTEAARVFKSGGGMGYAFHHLRPYGDQVGSTGGIASGPITFMRTYDQMCETVAQGGTRRGAQMAIMRVSHPDVIYFIHAKNKDVSLAETLRLNDPDDYTHNSFTAALEEARELIDDEGRVPKHLRNAAEGHLSNFNISVGVTDDFMDALFNDEDFVFTNPRTGEPHIATTHTEEMYGWFDLDEYVEPGEPLAIPANELWDRMISGAHENGEPGMVFIDRINEEHSYPVESAATIDTDDPMSEYEIHATNPCGEQPLMEGEACNLGHINLSTIADINAPDWREWSANRDGDLDTLVGSYLVEAIDWDVFDHRIQKGTHFLENVVTMSDFPIDKIEQTVADNRKIGLGIMGLAQLYIQLGVEYGSDEANEIAEQLMTHINHESKRTSHELAEDRGVFGNWEDSKFADPTEHPDWFERMTDEDPRDWEEGYPIRNHNTTTIAPTGTTSMLGNTTGGCEPIYNVAYFKNVTEDVQGDEMLVEFDDYFLRTLEANDIDVEAAKTEAIEQMSNNEYDGLTGLDTVPNEIGELFITTGELTPKEHAGVQTACQAGVDSAISKTVNAPNHSTLQDAKEVFEYIYQNGGKGVTYYRDGTRSKQVITTRAENTEFSDEGEAAEVISEQIQEAFDGLEQFLEQDEIQSEFSDVFSEDGTADVPVLGEEPNQNGDGYLVPRERPDVLNGVTQRIDTGYGKLYVNINEDDDGRPFEIFCNIGSSGGFTNSFTESLAKVISIALRSGVDPEEIQEELEGIRSPKVNWDRSEQITSIPDGVGTALRRYLNDEIDKGYPTQSTIDEAANIDAPTTDDEQGPELDRDPNRDMDERKEEAHQQMLQQGELPECPDCGAMEIYFSEGCKKCEACGWSEC